MTFFESLLVLLLAAIVLLQVARRLRQPYPALLAAAGVLLALVPHAPDIPLEPATALALFIAPAIVDSAFDYPIDAARRFRQPLIALAVVAVLLTAGAVALLAHFLLGLPYPVGLALGAIVAPPDAAAASAILGSVSIPRSTDAVLKGESLFNDATALLLFSTMLAIVTGGGLTPVVSLRIAAAVPGGILLGYLAALFSGRISRLVTGTLGGNLLQFVLAYLLWISAEHLQLSAVLCTITFAMTLANSNNMASSARMRVQSYAVWSAVVFVLNVFAFLLMGMQGRKIVRAMPAAELHHALRFAAVVVATVILARLAATFLFNRYTSWQARCHGQSEPASIRQAIFVGWCGMRGFVTLATAFALPESFPARNTLVLTAFAVVVATLVLQGLTLNPLVRLLHLDQGEATTRELQSARSALAHAALDSLTPIPKNAGDEWQHIRAAYNIRAAAVAGHSTSPEFALLGRKSDLALRAIKVERQQLETLRSTDQIGPQIYLTLQEEIDWRELSLLPDESRRIEEI